MNFLILGDVHLGKGLNIGKPAIGNGLNSRIIDQLNLLNWTLEQAIENHISRIIITGDIFEDSKPDYQLVNLFTQWCKETESHQIHIDIIVGNHDLRRTGQNLTSVLELLNHLESNYIHIYKDITTLIFNQTAIILLPFRDRKGLDQESNKVALDVLKNAIDYELIMIPPNFTKILIGHLALEGSLWIGDEIDDQANELICPLSMFANFHYVWMGHIHRPQILSINPYIAHIGSMDVSNFDEGNDEKIIIIFSTDLNSFEIKKNPTRPLKNYIFSIPDDQIPHEVVIKQLEKQNLKNAIIRLIIETSALNNQKLDKKQIEKWCYQQSVFHIVSITESKQNLKVVATNKTKIEHKATPKEAIKIFVEQLKLPENEENIFMEMALEDLHQIMENQK